MTKFHPVYREVSRSVRPTGAIHTAANPVRTVSGLFRTPELAERAIRAIERFGYNRHAFNVMMNRRIQAFFKPWNEESRTDHRTWEGARLGGLIGVLLGAVATFGATEWLQGRGGFSEESLVCALVGIFGGGLAGFLCGAVIGSGVSETYNHSGSPKCVEDEFLISVVPATSDDGLRIAEVWENIGGENIHH